MQYIIAGVGGQGILFTSRVLGKIAIDRGLSVIGSEVHGMAQRGGSVISHFRVGDYSGPLITEGHADVVMAFDQNEGIRNLSFLKDGGTFVVSVQDPAVLENAHLKKFLGDRKIRTCAFTGFRILDEHMQGNYLFLNVLILGAASGAGVEGFERDHVVAALKELAPPRHLDANLRVFELGVQAAKGQH
ncbi:MAG: 2-oxoacid:acceptor oxidoreductase family protein [Synergistaceae bacterium]|jgi:indolepyruvate ferredoxin oxidoreductase beta subunit|nr:2-oxoacid:acceptor oxidoreductase family protein [Synergistaceae bacterium]